MSDPGFHAHAVLLLQNIDATRKDAFMLAYLILKLGVEQKQLTRDAAREFLLREADSFGDDPQRERLTTGLRVIAKLFEDELKLPQTKGSCTPLRVIEGGLAQSDKQTKKSSI